MSSVNEAMTALANSIRNKTHKTDKLSIKQMALDVDSIGIQSASGTYTLATDGAYALEIDVSNIGFIPDSAVVCFDDTEYEGQASIAWSMHYQPDFVDIVPLAEPTNKDFTTTNTAIAFRGTKDNLGTAIVATNTTYIGKLTTSDKIIIRVGRSSSSYPIVAGTYKWFAYKIWG